jgi:putative ABC transport system permease protein
LENARRYDVRYRSDEITYVIAKARAGTTPEDLAAELRQDLYDVEVLTTSEFAARSMAYWMLETGVGITVVITAILGFAVGGLVTSQTLYAITNDHLANYATLLAVGFSKARLAGIVVLQSLILGCLGTAIGTGLFVITARVSATSPIPLESTPGLFLILVSVNLATCLGSAILAMRTLFAVDPVTVFGGQG